MQKSNEQSESPSAGAKPRTTSDGCRKFFPLPNGQLAFCTEHKPIGAAKDWDHTDPSKGLQFLGYREA